MNIYLAVSIVVVTLIVGVVLGRTTEFPQIFDQSFAKDVLGNALGAFFAIIGALLVFGAQEQWRAHKAVEAAKIPLEKATSAANTAVSHINYEDYTKSNYQEANKALQELYMEVEFAKAAILPHIHLEPKLTELYAYLSAIDTNVAPEAQPLEVYNRIQVARQRVGFATAVAKEGHYAGLDYMIEPLESHREKTLSQVTDKAKQPAPEPPDPKIGD